MPEIRTIATDVPVAWCVRSLAPFPYRTAERIEFLCGRKTLGTPDTLCLMGVSILIRGEEEELGGNLPALLR